MQAWQWGRSFVQKMATWSLVARLVFFFTLFAVLVWSVTLGISWKFDNKHINFFYDSHMQLFAKTLAEMNLKRVHGEVDELKDILPTKEEKRQRRLDEVNDDFSFAVFARDGTRILSDDDEGKYLPFLQNPGFHKVEMQDDDEKETWRVFVNPVRRGQYYIIVGQDKEYRQEMVFHVVFRHFWPWLVILPLFILGLAWILHKELRPLRALTQRLYSRHADDMTPLTLPTLTAETRPLVQALNTLFERIDSLLQSERAFVSNAAHELRTPLAGLRVQTEVLEMCMDDARARESALQKIMEGSTRCSRLVEQLLLLSSIEAKSPQYLAAEQIPWAILLKDAMDTVEEAAGLKKLSVNLVQKGEPRLRVGHGELWGIALRNILDNAVRYSTEGGELMVHLGTESVYVQNTAPHASQEVLAQLGQRFYRPPGQKERGSGLGLAIVRHIAGLHDAKLLVQNVRMHNGAEGLRVSVIF